jgi:hypothetical protein
MALELRKRTFELLSSKPDTKFKARDIAIWICETYPQEADAKLAKSPSLKSKPELLLNQLVAEISANRPGWQDKYPQLRTTEERPRLYYGTSKTEQDEVVEAEALETINDDQFLDALYRTLQAWGIGIRASKLKSFDEFVAALRAKRSEIVALENKAIDDPQLNVNETSQQLWRLIDSLDIVANNTRIVAGSKALHHLLPDLMVPIDRAYTQRFFCWQSPTFQYEQRACFEQAFAAFAEIARRTNPGQYINSGWHSSRTKVIDNAIVGLISDQQAAAEKSGIVKAQKTNRQSSVYKTKTSFKSSTPVPMSLWSSIARWCRGFFAKV